MSIHFLSRTRIETEVSITMGFCRGLALAMVLRSYVLFFRGQHRFCHGLINGIHEPIPRNGILQFCIDLHDGKLLCP